MAVARVKQPRTVVISGPSGSGKSTLVDELLKEYPTVFAFTVSYTTREPRPGEQDGREYHFVSQAKMEAMIANGEFVEWSEFSLNLYGSSKKTVEEVVKTGRIWLRIVDMGGVKNIQGTDHNALFIYISPPNHDVLEQRLRNRKTDSESVINRRLQEAKESMAFSKEPGIYDHILENDQRDVAYQKLKEILAKEIEVVLQHLTVVANSESSYAYPLTIE